MGYTPPYLEVRKGTGSYTVYAPTSTTGDDLFIFPNTTDTGSYLKLFGNGYLALSVVSGSNVYFREGDTDRATIYRSGTDTILKSITNNDNLSLLTTGSGLLKFGTYTAGAATDSTGYITILDAAGNSRKLMVQA